MHESRHTEVMACPTRTSSGFSGSGSTVYSSRYLQYSSLEGSSGDISNWFMAPMRAFAQSMTFLYMVRRYMASSSWVYPFWCMIFICLTMVDLPLSPEPGRACVSIGSGWAVAVGGRGAYPEGGFCILAVTDASLPRVCGRWPGCASCARHPGCLRWTCRCPWCRLAGVGGVCSERGRSGGEARRPLAGESNGRSAGRARRRPETRRRARWCFAGWGRDPSTGGGRRGLGVGVSVSGGRTAAAS